jgi:hypothetical protein
MQKKLLGFIYVGFYATGKELITFSVFAKYLEEQGNTMQQCISYLQTSGQHMIQLKGRFCIILSSSLVSQETGKANKNVSE